MIDDKMARNMAEDLRK